MSDHTSSCLRWLLSLVLMSPLMPGPSSAQSCPVQGDPSWVPFDKETATNLAGSYDFTVILESTADSGRMVHGKLDLWVPDSLYRFMEPEYPIVQRDGRLTQDTVPIWVHRMDRPLSGATTVDFAAIKAPFDPALDSRNPLHPGLRLEGKDLLLSPPPLGYYERDGMQTHLRIESVSPDGFAGHWSVDFGLLIVKEPPGGRFCAQRVRRVGA